MNNNDTRTPIQIKADAQCDKVENALAAQPAEVQNAVMLCSAHMAELAKIYGPGFGWALVVVGAQVAAGRFFVPAVGEWDKRIVLPH